MAGRKDRRRCEKRRRGGARGRNVASAGAVAERNECRECGDREQEALCDSAGPLCESQPIYADQQRSGERDRPHHPTRAQSAPQRCGVGNHEVVLVKEAGNERR
jgi:hypothetical protein